MKCFFCHREVAVLLRVANIWGESIWPGQPSCKICGPPDSYMEGTTSRSLGESQEKFIPLSDLEAKPRIARIMADRLKGDR